MRKLLVAVIGLAVVGIGTSLFVMFNLDDFVKDAIQSFASEAIKTPVSISEVKLALEAGDASIIGLNVSNPDGFSDSNIIEFGLITSKINAATMNQNPIMINEVIIDAPVILYEINQSGIANVDVLINSLAQTDSHVDSGIVDDLKMIIRTLIIRGGRITTLGDAGKTATLPTIKLSDIGATTGGVASVEVARILFSTLLDQVNSTVAHPAIPTK